MKKEKRPSDYIREQEKVAEELLKPVLEFINELELIGGRETATESKGRVLAFRPRA